MTMKTDIGDFEYPFFKAGDEFQKRFDSQCFSITRNKQMETELHNIILEHGWVKLKTMNVYSMSETNILNFVRIFSIQNEEQSVVYCKGRHLKRWQTSRLTPKSINKAQYRLVYGGFKI